MDRWVGALLEEDLHGAEDGRELSGLGQAVGAGCRSSLWHRHGPAGGDQIAERQWLAILAICHGDLRQGPGHEARHRPWPSTPALAPAMLNAQGPAIQVLITENRAHYQQLASHENEEPFAESHPTKHSLEPSIPWESTQAANGAFLLSTKAHTHREAVFISL